MNFYQLNRKSFAQAIAYSAIPEEADALQSQLELV